METIHFTNMHNKKIMAIDFFLLTPYFYWKNTLCFGLNIWRGIEKIIFHVTTTGFKKRLTMGHLNKWLL